MKISMIGHKDFPSRIGGVEVVVGELAPRMQSLGNQLTLYNRDMKNKPWHCYSDEGIELVQIPTPKCDSLNAVVYSVFATLCAIFKRYDVIHFHAIGPSAMIWLPHLLGIKTVCTVHGLDWQRGKWGGFASKYLKFGEKMAARFADEIIVLSQNNHDYFKKTYGRETNYIENGITPVRDLPANEITKKFGLEKDGYILFLARIVPEKGLHFLIDAYKSIKTDKKLVIAGTLFDSAYCKQIKEMIKDEPNIIATDFVSGDILEELYANCSVYVLPSEIEGMALTLLEALSVGARCLVSNIPENLETIGQYGYSFISANTVSLAKNLTAILEEKTDEKLKEEQIAYVRDRFNWDVVADKTLDLYRKINRGRRVYSDDVNVLIDKKLKLVNDRFLELEKKSKRMTEANLIFSDVVSSAIETRDMEYVNTTGLVRNITSIFLETISRNSKTVHISSSMMEVMPEVAAYRNIGKLLIPDSIFKKPGKLTPEEYEIVKKNIVEGSDIVKRAFVMRSPMYTQTAFSICRSHHERFDGSGYPDGLKGNEIPIEAQIVGIIDVFNALITSKPHRNAMTIDEAYEVISTEMAGQFNPELVRCFNIARGDIVRYLSDMKTDIKKSLSELQILYESIDEISK